MRVAALLLVALVLTTAAAGVTAADDAALDGLITYASYVYVPDNVNDDGSALCGVGSDARAVDLVPYAAGRVVMDAAWSPDGSGLAYGAHSNLAPSPKTVVQRSLGTSSIEVGPWGAQASWSPDGTRVAVSGVATEENSGRPVNSPFHIFTFVPGTDGETQVTDGSGEIWPAWAPDGRRIAFQRTDTRQIAVHELATGTETTLTGSRAGDFEPDWSPDGKRILFRHGTAISVMDADGTHPRDLHVHGVSAVWAPDGRRIAYFGVPSGALTVLDLATRKKLVLSLDGGGGRISWQRLGPAAYTSETPPKDCRSLAAPIPVRQGSARADRIVATKGRQWIEANGGNDRVRTGAAEDYVEGDAGDDRIETGAGADRLEGGSGADMLDGGSGDDLLYGGWGRDRIIGGPGNDYVDAHDGARDTVDCGAGRDYVDADRVDRVAPNCEEVRR